MSPRAPVACPQLLGFALGVAAVASGCAIGEAEPPLAGDIEVSLAGETACPGCAGGELDGEGLLAVVSRAVALRSDFVPETTTVPGSFATRSLALRPLATAYFLELADAARAEISREVRVGSAYRSFCIQCTLFSHYAAVHGEALADTFSARAGHSEHQLGTTADLFVHRGGSWGFSGGPYPIPGVAPADPHLYEWLDGNAWRFGFMNSYPPNDADGGDRFASRTFAYSGYIPEPWHWRFVGRRAAELHRALALATVTRYSTHEFIDLLVTDPDDLPESSRAAAERARELLADRGWDLADLEAPHPDDAAALARLQGAAAQACASLGWISTCRGDILILCDATEGHAAEIVCAGGCAANSFAKHDACSGWLGECQGLGQISTCRGEDELLQCDAANQAYRARLTRCAAGCAGQPLGQHDFCRHD